MYKYNIDNVIQFLKSGGYVASDKALACDVSLLMGRVCCIFADVHITCSTKEGLRILTNKNVKDIISLCDYLFNTFPDFRELCEHTNDYPIRIVKKVLVLSRNIFGEEDNTKDVYFITNGNKYLKMINSEKIGDITEYFNNELIIPIEWTNVDNASMIEHENEAKELLYNLIVHHNFCTYHCNDII